MICLGQRRFRQRRKKKRICSIYINILSIYIHQLRERQREISVFCCTYTEMNTGQWEFQDNKPRKPAQLLTKRSPRNYGWYCPSHASILHGTILFPPLFFPFQRTIYSQFSIVCSNDCVKVQILKPRVSCHSNKIIINTLFELILILRI